MTFLARTSLMTMTQTTTMMSMTIAISLAMRPSGARPLSAALALPVPQVMEAQPVVLLTATVLKRLQTATLLLPRVATALTQPM